MTSSRLQDPDEPNEASHNVTTSPPAAPIFFSLFCARKAIKRESADQNGYPAPSVPPSACGTRLSRDRTHSMERPVESEATIASRRPSGESTKRPGGLSDNKLTPAGSTIDVL
jgi:hypothetical protein